MTDNFKWPTFSWHYQITVLEWKCMNSVPKCPTNNIPALVQILAWHQPGPKPLSELMKFSLPTHICVIRPQWVNTLRPVVADDIFEYIQWKWFKSVSHLIEMCTQIFKLIIVSIVAKNGDGVTKAQYDYFNNGWQNTGAEYTATKNSLFIYHKTGSLHSAQTFALEVATGNVSAF